VRVWVDGGRCQGHTLCAMIAPEMFRLDDVDGTSSAVCEVVPTDQESAVREAAQSCPEQAIVVEESADESSGIRIGPQEVGEALS
jgi:ferredoxin